MADTPTTPEPAPPGPASGTDERPRFRPREQFWPYAHLEEEPSDEELERLDPDLQDALYDRPVARAFAYTVVFPPFDGPSYEQAVDLAKRTSEYLESGTGDRRRHRARFRPDQVLALRDLWQIVGTQPASDVLIDDRPVPYARELWLPLLWYLIPR
jgi:hypothetical protein